MKILFKIIVGFLAIIGALTLALAAYLYLADPFGLKALLQPSTGSVLNSELSGQTVPLPELSPAQIEAAQKLNIDVTKLPATIPVEYEQCAVSALGQARVDEIKAGAVPNAVDLFKAKACFSN